MIHNYFHSTIYSLKKKTTELRNERIWITKRFQKRCRNLPSSWVTVCSKRSVSWWNIQKALTLPNAISCTSCYCDLWAYISRAASPVWWSQYTISETNINVVEVISLLPYSIELTLAPMKCERCAPNFVRIIIEYNYYYFADPDEVCFCLIFPLILPYAFGVNRTVGDIKLPTLLHQIR